MHLIPAWLFILPASFLPIYQEQKAEESKGFDWSYHIELSYIQTSGNTETKSFAGKLETSGQGGINRLFFNTDVLFQKNADQETADRIMMDGSWELKFSERFFALLTGDYQRDRFSGYEHRFSVGPGIGCDLVASEKTAVKVSSSLNYYYDKLSGEQPTSDSHLAVKAGLGGEYRIRENLRLKNDFEYFISTDEWDNYFITNEAALYVNVNTFISIGIRYLIDYQNAPPSEGLKRLNTTFFSSLVFDF